MAQDTHENEMFALLQAGDTEALVWFYRTYGQKMFSLAYRLLGDPGTAEEVVQDVFVKLWRQPQMFDPDKGVLIAWLYTLTRNLALDRKRKENRRGCENVFSDNGATSSAMVEPEALALADPFLSQWMREALDSLPPEQREAVELAYFKGMTHAEISETLGEALGTVKTRLRLGLNKLRVAMRTRGQVKP